MNLDATTPAIVHRVPAPSEHSFRADVNRTGNMPRVEAQLFGYSAYAPFPLRRFDGRPVALIELRPAPVLAPCSITLWFWPQGFGVRDVSRAAFDLSGEQSKCSDVALFGQLSTDSRRTYEDGPIPTYKAFRLDAVDADHLEHATGDQTGAEDLSLNQLAGSGRPVNRRHELPQAGVNQATAGRSPADSRHRSLATTYPLNGGAAHDPYEWREV